MLAGSFEVRYCNILKRKTTSFGKRGQIRNERSYLNVWISGILLYMDQLSWNVREGTKDGAEKTKEILIKRLMDITESIKNQLWKIKGPKIIVGFPQEINSIKVQEVINFDSFSYIHMNEHLLLKNIKRAEFKRKLKKSSKVLVFGFIVLWSFLTFYGLYKDISWKDYIDQFRWLMFLVDSRLNSVFFS